MSHVKVLFVCLGNICRSPTAEGVFRQLVNQEQLSDKILIDSCGTSNYHIGDPPDPRSQEAALRRGIDISQQRARQLDIQDFYEFNYITAMDEKNLTNILQLKPDNSESEVKLFLEYAPRLKEKSVPDPYWSGPQGFDLVLDLVEEAAAGLLEKIKARIL